MRKWKFKGISTLDALHFHGFSNLHEPYPRERTAVVKPPGNKNVRDPTLMNES